MNINELLTAEDCKVIVKALEALPQSESSSDFVGGLLDILFAKTPEERKRAGDTAKQKVEESKKEKEAALENIRIIQGKILMIRQSLQK